jgi:hypothetical protein
MAFVIAESSVFVSDAFVTCPTGYCTEAVFLVCLNVFFAIKA